MAVDIKLRLYHFPSKIANGLHSIEFKEEDIDGKTLSEKISNSLNISSNQLSLIFRGKLIKPYTRLKALNFKSGQLLHVLYKKSLKDDSLSPDVDANRLKETMVGLHLIFWGRRQDHRGLKKNVIKLLKDSKRLQKIIDNIPGLKDQPISTDILRHPDIFGHVVEPTNFDKILQTNKELGAAILQVWDSTPSLKSVKDLLAAAAVSNRPTSSRTSPREDYEDEDMDTDFGFPTPATSRPIQGSNPPGVITSNQLAQALSMATSQSPGRGLASNPGSRSNSAIQTSQTGSGSGVSSIGSQSGTITAGVFSMAMQQALALANDPGGAPSQQSTVESDHIPTINQEVMARGMEQLRSMGIADEKASREALIAASGNVEAAVNILFASGLNDL